jgi:hypothetical protein
MGTDSNDTARPSGRSLITGGLTIVLLLLLVPVALVVIAALVFFGWMWLEHRSAAVAIQEKTARLEAINEPISTQDLYDAYRLPSNASDATQAWLAAMQSFDEGAFNGDGKLLPFVGSGDEAQLRPSATGSQLAAAEAFLQEYAGLREAVLSAAEQPGECRFPVQFGQGIAAPLPPHAGRLRCIVRYLALDMQVRAIQSDAKGAAESLDAMYASAATLESQLTMVEQRIRAAILGFALSETQWLLNEVELTDDQLVRLQARLLEVDPQASLTTGLLGERAAGLQSLSGQASTSGGMSAAYLDAMTELVEASRKPFPAASDEAKQVQAATTAAMKSLNPLKMSQRVVAKQAVDVHLQSFDNCGRQIALRNLLLVAIAAERHRLKTGAFPADLSELAHPRAAIDPFCGDSVRLIAGDGELTLYSVGENGIDEGGLDGKFPNQPDIVVRVKSKKGPAASSDEH